MDESRSKQTQAQQQIKAGIQNALDLASRCRSAETSENYEFLEEQLDRGAGAPGSAVNVGSRSAT